jgi:hypothetical protein
MRISPQMPQNLKHRKPVFLLIATLIMAFLLWCLGCVTIIPAPQSPLEKLEQARSLWNKQNISSYRMTVSFIRSLGFSGRFNFAIENNKVVKIEPADSWQAYLSPIDTFQPRWYTDEFGYAAIFPKCLDSFTIDQLFDFIADKVRNDPAPPVIAWCSESFTDPLRRRYDVMFDPQRGNIESVNFTTCPKLPQWGYGLLFCPMEYDCADSFSISDLTPQSK